MDEKNNAYLVEIASYDLHNTCSVLNFFIDIIRRVITNTPFAVRQVDEGKFTYICIYYWRQ